ncbi:N-acetyltransferase [Lactococcus hodotermopsidis]|uniref:N-acetyltransferase n=1 Tax=Pseudolactococcus hodotermopsidis TaxID=2709157 RepID=A0A6A0B9H5_9LACT|nr:GNAT family N-acetyltransferase [Lactococcus hodotermopsidis]GFH41456.1 N-acetyltransferase [Lactococcus hodotermopsidis]
MLIRNVTSADLNEIYRIESENFAPEEAATYEAMKWRISKISDTFLIAEIGGQIAGYIEGPAISARHLTDDLFETVVKNPATGGFIAVTSLSVDLKFQGKAVGTRLISALKAVACEQKRDGINLTCHDYLIAYYEKYGFINEGKSQSTHGGASWYDMVWENSEL